MSCPCPQVGYPCTKRPVSTPNDERQHPLGDARHAYRRPRVQHRRRFPPHTQSPRRLPSVRTRTRTITAPTNNPTTTARICSEEALPTPRASIPQQTPDGRTALAENHSGTPRLRVAPNRASPDRSPAPRPAGPLPPVDSRRCTPAARPVGNRRCTREVPLPLVGNLPCTPAAGPLDNHPWEHPPGRTSRPVDNRPTLTAYRAAPRCLLPGFPPEAPRRGPLRAFPAPRARTPLPTHPPARRACLPTARCPPAHCPPVRCLRGNSSRRGRPRHLKDPSSPGRNRCSPRTPWAPPRT